jgi:ABC-type transport system substrate-binding protein
LKKLSVLAICILAISLLASMQLPISAYSPRHCKGLDVYFYANRDSAFAALMAGEIDLYQYPLTYTQYMTACTNPDIQLALCTVNRIFAFAFNNNWTIADFPGVRSPINDVDFRRALACMVDKEWIVSTVLEGFGDRVDAPLAAAHTGYANESVIGAGYPYPYDLEVATARLDAAGYDDWDGDDVRNYPLDWDGVEGEIGVRDEPNLDPIKICIRTDQEDMLRVGRVLADTMRALDIPVNQIEATHEVLFPIVMGDMNYHIYTDEMDFQTYMPYPTYIYSVFHSLFCYRGGPNYVTGMNISNLPNYPDLDEALENVYYTPNMAAFVAAVKRATGLLIDKCVSVWLWNPVGWFAYRKNLVGIVAKQGTCIVNDYTFLNAYKVDDSATPEDESQDPIRVGTTSAPCDLNILYSRWYYEHAVLDRMFAKLLSTNPQAPAIIDPWTAQDYEYTTWFDPHDGKLKTKVTFWLRKDVWWHAPETGETVRRFNASDVEFSIWYACGFSDSWLWGSMKDVHHTLVIDDFTIEVYFDELSIWAPYWIGLEMPLLPWTEYEELLCINSDATVDITDPISPSDHTMFTYDWVTRIVAVFKQPEGIQLFEGVDFEVVNPESCHNVVHWLRSLEPGEWVEFYYVNPHADPHGYYLADLPWQLTFYSLGTHIPIDIQLGVGGQAIFDCNGCHFLGAPPLGEIDWAWTWVGTTKPRSGYYQISLYDAVILLKAYGTRGDTCPVPLNWCPGADIDSFDLCHIGLYDAVQLLNNYGIKFGIPPDP